MEKWISHPGSPGLSADLHGDCEPWCPVEKRGVAADNAVQGQNGAKMDRNPLDPNHTPNEEV
jgi:hypothetical protein